MPILLINFYNIELLNKEMKQNKENTLSKTPSNNKRLCIAHGNNIS